MNHKNFYRAVAGGLMALISVMAAASAEPLSFDMEAGPIWNQQDAENKCPRACALNWNGQWATVKTNERSVCGATNQIGYAKGDVGDGPIWNNEDAKVKCPALLAKVKWSGHWRTTITNKMSVCNCSTATSSQVKNAPSRPVSKPAVRMAYVSANTSLTNASCYRWKSDNSAFFNIVALGSVVLQGNDPNNPEIHSNLQTARILNKTRQVETLKKTGTKVLLTVLGYYDKSGWSCVTKTEGAVRLAQKLSNLVEKYKLDGIDIDDEYAACNKNHTENPKALVMIGKALRENPKFNGKLLTKALFNDQKMFEATYIDDKGQQHKLADYLDYGWQMNYGSSRNDLLKNYADHGMAKEKLAKGISHEDQFKGNAAGLAGDYKRYGYGGFMVFDMNKKNSVNGISPWLTEIAKTYNDEVVLVPNCLKEAPSNSGEMSDDKVASHFSSKGLAILEPTAPNP